MKGFKVAIDASSRSKDETQSKSLNEELCFS